MKLVIKIMAYSLLSTTFYFWYFQTGPILGFILVYPVHLDGEQCNVQYMNWVCYA